jgi:hypothetical protein
MAAHLPPISKTDPKFFHNGQPSAKRLELRRFDMCLRGARLPAAVAIAAVLVIAWTASAQDAWHTMTGPDRSFTADLPIAPKYTPQKMQTATGTAYTMHQYMVEQGATAYVVQSAVYPPDVKVDTPETNLKAGIENAAKKMEGGKWSTIDWVTHQGLVAVDAIGNRSGHEVRSFSVIKGRQIYTLTYAGPTGTARSAEVNRFIGSLRIP